jgi:hypothetical protein
MRFALVVDNACVGFVLARRHEFEAFDGNEKSLGVFQTEGGATTAVLQTVSSKST